MGEPHRLNVKTTLKVKLYLAFLLLEKRKQNTSFPGNCQKRLKEIICKNTYAKKN